MAATPDRPKMSTNDSDLLRCTLCDFTCPYRGIFQHHLMSLHGIKLKNFEIDQKVTGVTLGRILDDYVLYQCDLCKQFFKTNASLSAHKPSCRANKSSYRIVCEKCNNHFKSKKTFKGHLDKCKSLTTIYCCRLCAYRCGAMKSLSQHVIDRHNLIAKPVDEVDFQQALRGTPYTLERAVVVDTLPDIDDMAELRATGLFGTSNTVTAAFEEQQKIESGKYRMYVCPNCKIEFPKARVFYSHMEYNKCQI